MRRASRLGVAVLGTLVLVAMLVAPSTSGESAAAAARQDRCPDRYAWCDASLSPDRRAGLLLRALTDEEKVSLLAGDELSGVSGDADGHTGTSHGVPRLDVPPTYYTDGPAGVRQGEATAMPAPMALAAAFDRGVAFRHGAVVGTEARLKGNDVVFAPTVNIMRTPLGGRTFEGYGEDPHLVASTAVGWLRGAQQQGVVGSIKHFAANNQEGQPRGGNRLTVNAVVDERTLREVYLPAFEAAVKRADVGSLMCAYNRLNGGYACENQQLLNEVLKTDWGFDGYVLSDYGAAKSPVNGLNNGLDFEPWPGLSYSPAAVHAATATSQASEATVDEHVHRILRTLFAHGFFDRPAHPNDDALIDKRAHAAQATRVEQQAITLLRNDGTLPLQTGGLDSIALIGDEANRFVSGGGSSNVDPWFSTTPREGIEKRVGPGVEVTYDPGSDPQRAAAAAEAADVAVVFASDEQTEFRDKPCLDIDCGSHDDTDQDAVIKAVLGANDRSTVVLETGGPVLTPWRDQAPALLQAWYPGVGGGTALARVLFGDVDPGGRLPVTFPQQESHLPTAGDPEKYPGVGETVRYKEGVMVGYRWYDQHRLPTAFPFGHGLSYTDFAFDHPEVDVDPDHPAGTVSVPVRNVGDRPGTAVPQLYLGIPRPDAHTAQPPKQLRGFDKLHLRPGQQAVARFRLSRRDFAYWDAAADRWSVAPGCYTLMVGRSSRDITHTVDVEVRGGSCS